MKFPKVSPSLTDRKHLEKGEQFGYWTIMHETTPSSNQTTKRIRMFACKCQCGSKRAIRMQDLTRGASTQCGCMQEELSRKANLKHGFRQTRLHQLFQNMLNRCQNPKNKRYKDYGGRGIKVCDEWREGGLAVFGKWAVDNGYKEGLQIDRKNNNKGYNPKNCRFITQKENVNNMSTNLYVYHKNKRYSFQQFWENMAR